MSKLFVPENLFELEELLHEKEIFFEESLKTTTFLTILEIIWNIWTERDCQQCFSKKNLKKLKKEKEIIEYFYNRQKSVSKRKQKFLKCKNSFKKLITKLLKEFFKNCVEEIDNNIQD